MSVVFQIFFQCPVSDDAHEWNDVHYYARAVSSKDCHAFEATPATLPLDSHPTFLSMKADSCIAAVSTALFASFMHSHGVIPRVATSSSSRVK